MVRAALAAVLLLVLAACSEAPATDASSEDVQAASPRVELKVTLRPDQIEAARAALGLDDGDGEQREVTFYDTPKLDLAEAGVVLRARKIDRDDDDSTVKLRPMESSDVDAEWFQVDGFKCEIDRTGAASVESCSFTVRQDRGEIDDVEDGDRAIDKLFSDEQEDLLAQHASIDVEWDALTVLGPVDALVWEIAIEGLAPALDVELWTLPDGTEILEVSTKVKASAADDTAAALAEALEGLGLDASSAQETKTRAALEYFAR